MSKNRKLTVEEIMKKLDKYDRKIAESKVDKWRSMNPPVPFHAIADLLSESFLDL